MKKRDWRQRAPNRKEEGYSSVAKAKSKQTLLMGLRGHRCGRDVLGGRKGKFIEQNLKRETTSEPGV